MGIVIVVQSSGPPNPVSPVAVAPQPPGDPELLRGEVRQAEVRSEQPAAKPLPPGEAIQSSGPPNPVSPVAVAPQPPGDPEVLGGEVRQAEVKSEQPAAKPLPPGEAGAWLKWWQSLEYQWLGIVSAVLFMATLVMLIGVGKSDNREEDAIAVIGVIAFILNLVSIVGLVLFAVCNFG